MGKTVPCIWLASISAVLADMVSKGICGSDGFWRECSWLPARMEPARPTVFHRAPSRYLGGFVAEQWSMTVKMLRQAFRYTFSTPTWL
jgi:hypothetical protein